MFFAYKSYELSQLTCAGPFSATNFVSRLFFYSFAGFWNFSHHGFVLVLNVENSRRLHQVGMKKS